MNRRRVRAAVLAVALAAGLASALGASPASADDPSAEELKAEGNRAMMNLDYAEALADYSAALAKTPNDVALHYNIGRAQQARGDYPEALDALLAFERQADPETRSKVPSLTQLIADVRARVGELSVRCTADVAPGKGAVVVATTALPVAELAKTSGCGASPQKLRMSLPTKTAVVEVRLESAEVRASPVRVTLEGGAPAREAILAVVPLASVGVLRVVASPETARVAVDGAPKGNPPVEIEVAPGSHVVDVEAEDYTPAHVPFVIEAGGKRELNVALAKTPPITKRWWFWAGSGVVAAGIITLAVILIAQPERDSKKGTIDPGVIRAPLVTF